MAILDEKQECAPREAIRQMQLERLQATVNRAYRNVAYYREVFDAAGLLPEEIRSFDALRRLPFTSRDDLLDHQPYGLFAVPLRDVVRLHPAAGAGGPIMVGYTSNDIRVWTRMAARALAAAGVTPEDVIQISLDYALEAAAMGAQSGAEALGASVIPCSGLSPERQVEVMHNYRATVLVATASQALQFGRALHDSSEPAPQQLRLALIVGERWSGRLRDETESLLEVDTFAAYGLSEMAVPGMATECAAHQGLHISEDNVLAEIVDPDTGDPVPFGEPGELVLTTLTREAVPMLRYRTGDLTVLHEEVCECGRTQLRMEASRGRTDDVVIVAGQRVAPSQVQEIVEQLLPGSPVGVDVVEKGSLEELEVVIGIDPSTLGDIVGQLEALRDRIREDIFERLALRAEVRLVEPGHFRRKRPGDRE